MIAWRRAIPRLSGINIVPKANLIDLLKSLFIHVMMATKKPVSDRMP